MTNTPEGTSRYAVLAYNEKHVKGHAFPQENLKTRAYFGSKQQALSRAKYLRENFEDIMRVQAVDTVTEECLSWWTYNLNGTGKWSNTLAYCKSLGLSTKFEQPVEDAKREEKKAEAPRPETTAAATAKPEADDDQPELPVFELVRFLGLGSVVIAFFADEQGRVWQINFDHRPFEWFYQDHQDADRYHIYDEFPNELVVKI